MSRVKIYHRLGGEVIIRKAWSTTCGFNQRLEHYHVEATRRDGLGVIGTTEICQFDLRSDGGILSIVEACEAKEIGRDKN